MTDGTHEIEANTEVAGRSEFALLCCPFCGSYPVFPAINNVYGTCYDAGCEDCGVATISIQIIDCFDYGDSPNREDAYNSWDDQEIKYGDAFIEVARNEAIATWNKRTTGAIDTCDHAWVPADNEVVTGGKVCTKCHTIEAT